jgi:hypothetical protein
VRTHPTLSSIIKTACMDYALPNHPDFRDLFVTKSEDGEETNFQKKTFGLGLRYRNFSDPGLRYFHHKLSNFLLLVIEGEEEVSRSDLQDSQ